jgi:hypothetical protein
MREFMKNNKTDVPLQATRWRKPISEVGGITEMVHNSAKQGHWAYILPDPLWNNYTFIVHAYREVGTAVDAVVEIRSARWACPESPKINFYNITI